jgi:hypothetical protein
MGVNVRGEDPLGVNWLDCVTYQRGKEKQLSNRNGMSAFIMAIEWPDLSVT